MSRKTAPDERRNRGFLGLLLVGIGILMLIPNLFQNAVLPLLILPGISLLFLAGAFYNRQFGFAVPGCILTGLGAALLLEASGATASLSESGRGGVFVLGLALGFVAIALLSPYFERKFVPWPLIPGGILALVGVLLFIGGGALNLLEWLGKLWPLALIAIGAYVLFAPRRKTQ